MTQGKKMNCQFRFNSSLDLITPIHRVVLVGKRLAFEVIIVGITGLYCVSFFSTLDKAMANEATSSEAGACVICNDPGKVYQCTFKSSSYQPDTAGQSRTINIKGLHFACIQEIAQYGGHGQCAAVRKSINDCNGEIYQLKNKASVEQILVPVKPETDQLPQESNAKSPQKDQPTLVGETKKTYKKTTKSVKKTFDNTSKTVKKTYDKTSTVVKKSVKSVGQGIGDAASTTYDCLTSFFTKCGK